MGELIAGPLGTSRHALPLLGTEPFFYINSDIIWLDDGEPGAREEVVDLVDAPRGGVLDGEHGAVRLALLDDAVAAAAVAVGVEAERQERVDRLERRAVELLGRRRNAGQPEQQGEERGFHSLPPLTSVPDEPVAHVHVPTAGAGAVGAT